MLRETLRKYECDVYFRAKETSKLMSKKCESCSVGIRNVINFLMNMRINDIDGIYELTNISVDGEEIILTVLQVLKGQQNLLVYHLEFKPCQDKVIVTVLSYPLFSSSEKK